MNIKRNVLSGGGYNGIDMIGIIYKLKKLNLLNIDNIKSVYGVAQGSIVCAIFLLGIDKHVI